VVFPTELWTLIRRETVARVAMTGQFPLGLGGPLAGRVPPSERGPSGGALDAP
jgi:hypothetical protein